LATDTSSPRYSVLLTTGYIVTLNSEGASKDGKPLGAA
jgi:hypothetical protein